MSRKVLVINSGSSSLKYRLFGLEGQRVVDSPISGLLERIGEPQSPITDHRLAIDEMVRHLEQSGQFAVNELVAVGHRVVHGGEAFNQAALADDAVIDVIRAQIPLAPLHNPANLMGIQSCRERWPAVPQVAVFDTAFHQTLTEEAYRYAIPASAYHDHRIRRYGFHGTSFAHAVRSVADFMGRPRESLSLIVMHLGNGASACAIRNGCSIDTSMGMTPLAGLMMGTRCGDLDPGVILYWLDQIGESPQNVSRYLNRQSGLKGIAGSNDMRDILESAARGDSESKLAFEMYVHRIRHYIGAYRALLPRLDALVFTGGVGEHANPVREAACRNLQHLGLELDDEKNWAAGDGAREIQLATSKVRILVIPADEELEIASQSFELVGQSGA